MTIEQFYDKIGANYSAVLKRLASESLILTIVKKFPAERSFSDLNDAFTVHDAEKAFRVAHTLKGITLNLGFDNLYEPTYELTEKLRTKSFDGTEELFNKIKKLYETIIGLIPEIE